MCIPSDGDPAVVVLAETSTLLEHTSTSSAIPSDGDPAVVVLAETSTLLEHTFSTSSAIPSDGDPAVVVPAEASLTSSAINHVLKAFLQLIIGLGKPERERRTCKKPRRYQWHHYWRWFVRLCNGVDIEILCMVQKLCRYHKKNFWPVSSTNSSANCAWLLWWEMWFVITFIAVKLSSNGVDQKM